MSGFSSIIKNHKQAKEQPEETTPPPSPAPAEAATVEVPEPPKRPKSKQPEPAKKRGRPCGKRSDSDYNQVTAYIRSDTHKSVKKILLDGDGGKDFSDLVEELLAKWLRSRT